MTSSKQEANIKIANASIYIICICDFNVISVVPAFRIC